MIIYIRLLNGAIAALLIIVDVVWIGTDVVEISTVNYTAYGAIVAEGFVVKNDILDYTFAAEKSFGIIRARQYTNIVKSI